MYLFLLYAALKLNLVTGLGLTIELQSTIATSSPLLSSHGWEAWQMLDSLHTMHNSRAEDIASHLSPSVIRVGGITGDWFRYILDSSIDDENDLIGIDSSQHLLKGFWPSAPQNISIGQFYNLTSFMTLSNLSLLFDLNELFGRNCNTTKPGCQSCTDWCGSPPLYPPWDMSNVREFLQRLHDDGMAGGAKNALFGFELGNELAGHLDPAENSADILSLSEMIQTIWSDVPESERPIFVAPSTDDCYNNYGQTFQIMQNVSKAIDAFSYHAYPAGDGHNLQDLLLNATWLRSGILTGSNSQQCLDDWNAGPRAAGMDLWVTEASSSWNWQGSNDPPWPPGQPGQNSFMHGFFTLSELGQYAKLGVPVVARWAFALGGSFGLLSYAPSPLDRFDVAADYWVLLAQKQLMGNGVLNVSGDDVDGSNVLVFSQCTLSSALVGEHHDISLMRHGGSGLSVRELLAFQNGNGNANGTITIMAVNVGTESTTLSFQAAGGNGDIIPTTPRLEYVFTPPGGDIGSLSSLLNDNETPLRVLPDGSLPSLAARYVDVGGATELTLPPQSQSFFVLLAAGANACKSA